MFKLIIAVVLLASPAFGETYSWEDNQGVHFTDAPQNIPSKSLGKATVIHDDGRKENLKASNKRNRAAAVEAENRRKEELRQKPPTVEYTGPLFISIGMDERHIPFVVSKRFKTNTTNGAYGTHTQYVFDTGTIRYVYTENGRVTSWQSTE